MITVRNIAILALLGLFLSSCGRTAYYQDTVEVSKDGWMYTDTLGFDYHVSNDQQLYDLELTIKHSDDFRYENLYVRFETVFPSGQSASEITSLNLTNNKGSWTGDCSKNSCEIKFLLRKGVNFTQTGDYHIKVAQYSRKQSLKSVEAVTFSIYDSVTQ